MIRYPNNPPTPETDFLVGIDRTGRYPYNNVPDAVDQAGKKFRQLGVPQTVLVNPNPRLLPWEIGVLELPEGVSIQGTVPQYLFQVQGIVELDGVLVVGDGGGSEAAGQRVISNIFVNNRSSLEPNALRIDRPGFTDVLAVNSRFFADVGAAVLAQGGNFGLGLWLQTVQIQTAEDGVGSLDLRESFCSIRKAFINHESGVSFIACVCDDAGVLAEDTQFNSPVLVNNGAVLQLQGGTVTPFAAGGALVIDATSRVDAFGPIYNATGPNVITGVAGGTYRYTQHAFTATLIGPAINPVLTVVEWDTEIANLV